MKRYFEPSPKMANCPNNLNFFFQKQYVEISSSSNSEHWTLRTYQKFKEFETNYYQFVVIFCLLTNNKTIWYYILMKIYI